MGSWTSPVAKVFPSVATVLPSAIEPEPKTAADAVNSIADTLNKDFNDLVKLMNSIGSDGAIAGTHTLEGITIDGKASDSGTMLKIANATSLMQTKDGQLADGAMKAGQLSKTIAQKVG
jgi:hypothetical protein